MYYLYIRDGIHDGVGHYHLVGVFPPSHFWTTTVTHAIAEYGENNVTYRFHI